MFEIRWGSNVFALPKDSHPNGFEADFISARGFAAVLALTLRLRKSSVFFSAPVCSSWVWINRATNKRSCSSPLGDVSVESVAKGNKMVSNLAGLCWLLAARGICFVIEQPQSSLLEHHPKWQRLAAVLPLYKVGISMGRFGAETLKPTILYSQCAWLQNLKSYQAQFASPTKQLCIKDHRGVTGGKELKGSQAYPAGFGQAMVRWYEDVHLDNLNSVPLPRASAEQLDWSESSIGEVLRDLGCDP
eukprot:856384-Amphidinium_carterae.1